MANQIAAIKNYTKVLDAVYQKASVSGCLASGGRMVRAGRNAKEIMIPKIEVSGLGDYTRNVGYKTGSISFDYETKTFNYDRGIKLLADVMDVEEAGAFTFSEIAHHDGVKAEAKSYADAEAADILRDLRAATNEMDELEVTEGGRILFITPTLKGVLDDFSLVNPNLSKHVLTRFSRIVEVPQRRFYSHIDLLTGADEAFGFRCAVGTYELTKDAEVDSAKTYYSESGGVYSKVASPSKSGLAGYYELVGAGGPINWLICEKSAVIKFDKHVASRVFSPDELENLDSYMRKYRKYGIVELLDNKLDGVRVCTAV